MFEVTSTLEEVIFMFKVTSTLEKVKQANDLGVAHLLRIGNTCT